MIKKRYFLFIEVTFKILIDLIFFILFYFILIVFYFGFKVIPFNCI